ncbi:MAG TPA: hypothetical protein VF134_03440 [Candidatus Dormibacteraeota bacterium]
MSEALVAEIATDFNSVDSDGRLTALAETAHVLWYPLAKGSLVRVHDYEGNRCYAVIDEVDEDLIYCVPYWESWESTSDRITMSVPTLLPPDETQLKPQGGSLLRVDSPPTYIAR